MNDQTTETESTDEDGFPPVHFQFYNMNGGADTVSIKAVYLGMSPYMMITPGDGEVEVEVCRFDPTGAAMALALALTALLQGGAVEDANIAQQIRDLVYESNAQEE